MTEPHLPVPPGTIVGVPFPLLAPGTAVYDYGVLRSDGAGSLHCPCGRTDTAERAERVIAEHLGSAPVGSRAAIIVRNMASDGTTGPAHLYALAERGEHCVTWPTYQGISPLIGEAGSQDDGRASSLAG
ncbi:MAG TPA: hypothetical protein VN840_07780 [Streptosporangiaceae bacterium]|nr:hypothetical protein [Streptosporangiaceae bacterium]